MAYVNQLLWKPEKTQIINSTGFLPLIDSPNGLPKLKFVESTVFEIIGGSAQPPPFVEGVGTKYLRTGRVNLQQRLNFLSGTYTMTPRKSEGFVYMTLTTKSGLKNACKFWRG